MLKAGALYLVLAVSLLLTLLTGSFILFNYYQHLIVQKSMDADRVQRNALAGMEFLLSNHKEIIPGDKEKVIDLFGRQEDSVSLSIKPWGAFQVLISKSFCKGKQNEITAISGCLLDLKDQYSLYLADHDKPISLCGKTILSGKCFLPKAGLKMAFIEGKSFEGSKLLDGTSEDSKREIPEINNDLIKSVKNLLTEQVFIGDSIVIADKETLPDTINRPFTLPSLILLAEGSLEIKNKAWQGNVIVLSKQKITIEKGNFIKDLIFAAPQIEVEEDAKLSAQLFSADSLHIHKNVTLDYPSILGMIPLPETLGTGKLILEEGSKVKGCLFTYSEVKNDQKHVLLSIGPKTEIYGQVYSSDFLDLKGEVKGYVIADKLILNTPSSVYENHLLDAAVDVKKLPEGFIGINLLKDINQRGILRWIH